MKTSPNHFSWLSNIVFRLRRKQLSRGRPRELRASTRITPVTSVCCLMVSSLASVGSIVLYILDNETEAGDLELVCGLVTLYTALSLGALLNILEHFLPVFSPPRAVDKLAVSLAFLIQLLCLPPSSSPDLALVSSSILLSLVSGLAVAASSRLLASLGVILLTQAQGGLALHNQLSARGPPGLVTGVLLLASLLLHSLILALARRDKTGGQLDNFIRRKQWRIKDKKGRQSKETLVRDSLDTSGDTEPINFSFYFKDEISDEIKTVMKTIDEMLISETADKKLPAIPELGEEDGTTRENIYVNVNVVRAVLDDSKLEETEIV